jgi:hypothetical protein
MIYTIYDPNTFDVLFAQDFETQPPNSTDKVLTEYMVKPKFDPNTEIYYESATPEEIKAADHRYSPDYYLVRQDDGSRFVRHVTSELLDSYLTGQRTLRDIMTIEELLEKVIAKLNDGNFITAKYKMASVVGLEQPLYDDIMAGIDSRITIHYPSA